MSHKGRNALHGIFLLLMAFMFGIACRADDGRLVYRTDFEQDRLGSAPAQFKAEGAVKVEKDAQGQILHLVGTTRPARATLTAPGTENLSQLSIRFKARYVPEHTGFDQPILSWQVLYRLQGNGDNCRFRWTSHNCRYALSYAKNGAQRECNTNSFKDYIGQWHAYEIRLAGVKQQAFFDGQPLVVMEDATLMGVAGGQLQLVATNGMDLQIDDLEVRELEAPYFYFLSPAFEKAAKYAAADNKGFVINVNAGGKDRHVAVNYRVHENGKTTVLASGSSQFDIKANENHVETVAFTQPLRTVGLYVVDVTLDVDGQHDSARDQSMRFCVARDFAKPGRPDLEMESCFGYNDGFGRDGIRSIRWGLPADLAKFDANGKPTIDFTKYDEELRQGWAQGVNLVGAISTGNVFHGKAPAERGQALKNLEQTTEAMVAHYQGKVRYWETVNEPEGFWHPYDPQDLTDMAKSMYRGLKRADLDASLVFGCHTSGFAQYLPKELELGAYENCDALSCHIYIYDGRKMPDDVWNGTVFGPLHSMVDQYGGWRDYLFSEGGWTTAYKGPDRRAAPEKEQADYLTRGYLIMMMTDQCRLWEAFRYQDIGLDDTYGEHMWGVVDYYGRPKPSYLAINNLMATLKDARYVGKITTGDAVDRVYMFSQNGQAILIGWRAIPYDNDTATVPPTKNITLANIGQQVTVRDIQGRDSAGVTSANGALQLTLSGSPTYVLGVNNSVVNAAARTMLAEKVTALDAQLAALPAVFPRDGYRTDLTKINNALLPAAATGNGAALEISVHQINALMLRMAADVSQHVDQRAPCYVAMESLYNLSDAVGRVLMHVYAQKNAPLEQLKTQGLVEKVTSAYQAKKGDGLLPVSTSALMRLRRYARLADQYQQDHNPAISRAYSLLAAEFAPVVNAIVASEPVK